MPRRPEEWIEEYNHITRIFPSRLAELMNGMSYSDLSELSGVSAGTLTSWSKGRSVPDLCLLFAVCHVLNPRGGGASIDYLIGLDEPMSSEQSQQAVSDTQQALSDTQQALSDTQSTE